MTTMPAHNEFATLTSDDLVTGEAVALDLPPAGLGVRLASGLIDYIATLVLLFVTALIVIFALSSGSAALQGAGFTVVLVTVLLVIPTTVETLTRGKSLGKLVLGLRTLRDDAGPISFHHALVRSLIGLVEIFAFQGVPAFFSALISQRGKRLGDFAAGTYVVRERVRLELKPPAPMPPELGAWAQTADIAALPIGLALAVRQFIGRAAAIDPVSRDHVGRRLAGEVMQYVAPPPPPGTAPDRFLAAVIASRRERDLARLRRDSELRRRLTARR